MTKQISVSTLERILYWAELARISPDIHWTGIDKKHYQIVSEIKLSVERGATRHFIIEYGKDS